MKKQYERPTAEKVSFQLTEDVADISVNESIAQGGGYWGSINEMEEGYQNP